MLSRLAKSATLGNALALHWGVVVCGAIGGATAKSSAPNRWRGAKQGALLGFGWPIFVPLALDCYLDNLAADHGRKHK